MKNGDIVVIEFPFSNLTEAKIRPAVVVTVTFDKHKDTVVCLISSVVPQKLNKGELLLQPSKSNNLRSTSVVKVYRVTTVQRKKILSKIGSLSSGELKLFIQLFQSLVKPQ